MVELSRNKTPAEVAGGVFLPYSEITARVTWGDFVLELTVRIVNRKPVCDVLKISARDGGPRVTAAALREIPLAAVQDRMLEGLGFPYRVIKGENVEIPTNSMIEARAKKESRTIVLPRIVEAYRDAIARGSTSPTLDVATQLHYARGYVSRMLSEARREGLLGPARPGVAGEPSDD